MQEYIAQSAGEMADVAKKIRDHFPDERKFALYGEMGAGKTTLVRAFKALLDIEDPVSSPTFSLINEYFSQPFGAVFHCDFYRLKNEREAVDIGVMDLFESNGFVFVEWPEKIENLLPTTFVKVKIIQRENDRLIQIDK